MSHQTLLQEVSAKLRTIFTEFKYDLDPDETYLNAVVINDQGKQVVSYSQTLSWAIMEKVQDNELPAFHSEFAGVFSAPWTFDPQYRVNILAMNVDKLNILGGGVVRSFREE